MLFKLCSQFLLRMEKRMKPIIKNLYQFSMYIPPMDLTIHQYLLVNNKSSILFSTGTIQQAEKILPEIKEILNGNTLDYIFVSHIESDECGGLATFLNAYPNVKVICSKLGARELHGYGYKGEIIIGNSEEEFVDENFAFQFIDYPSEVHLQDGIVCFEKNTGILYSADLMLSFGNACGQIISSNWAEDIEKIPAQQIPNKQKLEALKKALYTISPSFVAVGHGFCLEYKQNER